MISMVLEVRDRATFIPVLVTVLTPGIGALTPTGLAETYLIQRCGYGLDNPSVMMTRLNGGSMATTDLYQWGNRTMEHAHLWVCQHWRLLKSGDVVDVEYILGETKTPKVSERVTAPL